MYIRAMEAHGLRVPDLSPQGAGSVACEGLGRAVVLTGPPAWGRVVLDALSLFFGAFDPEAARRALVDLGVATAATDVEMTCPTPPGLPQQARWPAADGARCLLEREGDRAVRIQADLVLDPVMFRALRESALRSPDVVTALGGGPLLRVTVGWLFGRSLDLASIAVLALEMGGVRIPVSGSERPPWLDPFLSSLAGRFGEVGATWAGGPRDSSGVGSAWLEAVVSSLGARQRAQESLARTLEGRPFGWRGARPVRWNRDVRSGAEGTARVVAGPDLAPVERMGLLALRRLEVAGAVHLSGAEILGLDGGLGPLDADLLGWLEGQAQEDASPLEQVILACPPAHVPDSWTRVEVRAEPRPGGRSVGSLRGPGEPQGG